MSVSRLFSIRGIALHLRVSVAKKFEGVQSENIIFRLLINFTFRIVL